ncbi:hypothetical protein F511_42354 [Dorcoceras hygrometricum]|uniref:Uncharacterized protein n=1 Tax=Dorcoceras hygrometricum TaxID=472368 RepID=A0A2Z7DC03_9LAMI|nr:hypothetical protein F511_42354 [Dorcoceras hygrometricum]
MKKAVGALSIDDVISSDITISRKLSAVVKRSDVVQDDLSAESYSATSRWYFELAIAKRCRSNKLVRQRFAFALRIQQMLFAMRKTAVASFSRPTTGQPAASTSRRNQQYIQTRATLDQLLIYIQSQDDVPVAAVVRDNQYRRS